MERIDREIKVIKLGESIDYFLILWDIVKWCRENDILTGIGRGSAGGSLVAYLLEITQLDPLRWGLLFERFLNEGRVGHYEDYEKYIVHFENGETVELASTDYLGKVLAKDLKVGMNVDIDFKKS